MTTTPFPIQQQQGGIDVTRQLARVPASASLRAATANQAKTLIKQRGQLVEQITTLQIQLNDVERSFQAAMNLMAQIDRDGMEQKLHEELEPHQERES